MEVFMNTPTTHVKANHRQLILFWAILFFAFVTRILYVDSIPAGINQDEAMGAMDAWALSQYGTDRYGIQWPVHFKAWGYSQMSVLLAYCMIPFIKLFGFSTFVIRIPMVLASTAGIALVYLVAKKFFSANLSLAVMAFAAVNPWHFMQSRWSLDCNLFPHVFLLAFYLLLCGFKKRRYLYLSMVFFGLTFYCYGIAVYTVPVFLFVFAAWCLWKKEFKFREILISVCIFFAVALPEILTMFINMFGFPTIETPWFTIPSFPETVRGNDILFLNFSFYQLGRNAMSMLKQVFLQCPDYLFNTLPDFGPLYHISTPFIFVGIWQFGKHFFVPKHETVAAQPSALSAAQSVKSTSVPQETAPSAHPVKELFCTRNATRRQTFDLALLGFLIMGIWAGLITYEVNVNRINIIFYPIMFLTVYGIACFVKWLAKWLDKCLQHFKKNTAITRRVLTAGFLAGYSILSVNFFAQYFGTFPTEIRTMFNVDFLSIIKEADSLEDYDTLYVTSNMGWQTNYRMSEILTQYSCQIDALYYQELTTETGGRTLLPYSERYHFVDLWNEQTFDAEALYVVHEDDLKDLETRHAKGYDVVIECGEFYAIDLK